MLCCESVCTCMCVKVCEKVCVCFICVVIHYVQIHGSYVCGGWRLMLGIVCHPQPPYSLRQGLSIKPRAHLCGWLVLLWGSFFSTFWGWPQPLGHFHVFLGSWSPFLTVGQQSREPLSHFSIPLKKGKKVQTDPVLLSFDILFSSPTVHKQHSFNRNYFRAGDVACVSLARARSSIWFK